ncbi:glutamine amidotransferase [Cellulomonas sp. zg-ZUI222]|uniref:Glutamine amidotransferase n=1 Tax=Cellulomonas wangleii TaxID=2816956 RepID=A0ABX8D257_9CELL|nr:MULTISPECIES: glutamine amidotransferase [Cellulomonas]MBO0899681.1 glutamine amidotransferase [Cellulomonas sp. zg-ZUI22]MBO0920543.1 glutamine amidotransferase [Cellulomonas wangleii]MBO0923039.1 glutamine amidotransferase [Cellulomonas wangleii]QVI61424.1 glutamine amidotransferase [Cellulomonas wangleii]
MKPFLFLGVRPEDGPADDEYAAVLRCTGLDESTMRRVRLEAAPLRDVDLDDWSGIVLGGGPFCVSDPEPTKSAVQRRVEADLARLLDAVVPADVPFLGACYGIGTLGRHQGGVVDGQHAEPVGAVTVELTAQGVADPVLGAGPATFQAFVGHKESLSVLPPHAVLLATSAGAPVQAFRVGRNVYATQFHPELDVAGLETRVDAYRFDGYFDPEEAEDVVAAARRSGVHTVPPVLRAFVERHVRPRDHGRSRTVIPGNGIGVARG